MTGFKKARRLSQKDNDGYYLVYYKLLDYTSPLAIQAAITLAADFDGEIVNEIYNMNPNYKMRELHIAIFPLKNKTAIIMFIDNGEKRYKNFIHQFNGLDENEKLGVISYMVFLYSEDYFISKKLEKKLDFKKLKNVAGQMPTYCKLEVQDPRAKMLEDYRLDKWSDFPNLLDRQYSI